AFKRLNGWLKERNILVNYTEEASYHIYEVGFKPGFGARPLKRAMRKEVMLPISKLMLKDKIKKDHVIDVGFEDNKLVFIATKKEQTDKKQGDR
ncbi:MAG: hypothetical protein KAS32_22540, partial [Candidatus Peribacteraceae bacterium]|nr:hypothetical protein [Candidatus Peribacteraceae bacterium]